MAAAATTTSIIRTVLTRSRRRPLPSSPSLPFLGLPHHRSSSSSSSSAAAIFMPLPKLAPAMTTGKIHFLKKEGEPFTCYDIIAEVSSSNLVEEAHQMGKFAGEVTLLIEAQEDGYIAKILKEDPQELLPVGVPVAILCEEEEELEEVAARAGGGAAGAAAPTDLYAPEAQDRLRVWNSWQAYLKGPPDPEGSKCGCG